MQVFSMCATYDSKILSRLRRVLLAKAAICNVTHSGSVHTAQRATNLSRLAWTWPNVLHRDAPRASAPSTASMAEPKMSRRYVN